MNGTFVIVFNLGSQVEVKAIFENEMFVLCFIYRLNLVLSQNAWRIFQNLGEHVLGLCEYVQQFPKNTSTQWTNNGRLGNFAIS